MKTTAFAAITPLTRAVASLHAALQEGEIRHVIEKVEDHDDEARFVIETVIPGARITILVTAFDFLDRTEPPHFFVNFSHDCGDFACHEGTPSLTRALMDLGAARECAGRVHLRLQDAAAAA